MRQARKKAAMVLLLLCAGRVLDLSPRRQETPRPWIDYPSEMKSIVHLEQTGRAEARWAPDASRLGGQPFPTNCAIDWL
jgi:hypothetical protein